MVPKLIVSGLDLLNGEYPVDPLAMQTIGDPECLTNREGHRIKQICGVRMGELEDAMIAGDNDLMLALAVIVMERHGKTVDVDRLWDSPIGSSLAWDYTDLEQEEADVDVPPPDAPPLREPTDALAPSGGGSSRTPSEPLPVSGQSHTGPRLLVTPSEDQESGSETLAS